jgi:MoaA/NifB/PqqE/SkfB family radical SAM enzyme
MIVLTGGEPLLRPDLPDLVESGSRAGLRMVLGTNGVLLTRERIALLQNRGLQGAGISLDSTHPAGHDAFRGVPGAFAKSCEAVRACREMNLHAQVHFTVTRRNQGEIEDVAEMARDLGASIVNFFFLVCVGRGSGALDLDPDAYEGALRRIARLQRECKGSSRYHSLSSHSARQGYSTSGVFWYKP